MFPSYKEEARRSGAAKKRGIIQRKDMPPLISEYKAEVLCGRVERKKENAPREERKKRHVGEKKWGPSGIGTKN